MRAGWHAATLAVVWIAGAAYGWHNLDRGWFPNNAGAFALSAERVLEGQLPHRDFDEIYTGGDDYLHALAFKVFGVSFAATRRALYLVFLLWIPAVYYVATRFAPWFVAGVMTLLAVAWSLPVYADPIASWYNLFLATFGLAALLRYFETRRSRWLWVVGLCGGLSLLVKIIGVYLVAGAVFALLYDEQRNGSSVPASGTGGRSRARALRAVLVTLVIAAAAGPWLLVQRWQGATGVLQFAVPIASLGAVLVFHEITRPLGSAGSRVRGLVRRLGPVVAGVLLTVTPFLLPYALSGSLGDLARGVFVEPRKRLSVTMFAPPMPSWTTAASMMAFLLWVPHWPKMMARLLGLGLVAWAVVVFVRGATPVTVGLFADSIRAIVPTTMVAGCLVMLSRRIASERSPLMFASIAMAGWCSLVQFPVADTFYLAFMIPLGVLAVLAVFDRDRRTAQAGLLGLAAVAFAFSIPGIELSHKPDAAALSIDRAGILVRESDKALYEAVVSLVRAHGGTGRYIYATPDCPEIYFLSGYRNPTRSTYEFFDDPEGRAERIRAILERTDVHVVVLNRSPQFSPLPPDDLLAHFRATYPESATVKHFEVRWKP